MKKLVAMVLSLLFAAMAILPAAETATAKLSSIGDNHGSLTVTATISPSTSDDHPEWPDATPIVVPSTTSGVIESQGDRDWFKFPAIEMMLLDSPPTPTVNVSHTIVKEDTMSPSAVILSDVPRSEWTYGCAATSAGMLFGYYDRTGYPNMYTGPTNGGVCPLTDLGQGIPGDPGYPIPGSCYIIATENGLDGISSNAHVDDYWISYLSAGPDPWEGNWPEHTWGLCTADFLGTNQWKWDYSSYPGTDGVIDTNTDVSTALWTANSGSKLMIGVLDLSTAPPRRRVAME